MMLLAVLLPAILPALAQVDPEISMIPPHPMRLPEAVIPAFPGAWGAGMFTQGGRGGQVILVTNLNDSGEGSLRAALEAEGPRIVVFRTAGLIVLDSDLNINNPYITIAGQTAPGDGICIKGTLNINTYEVILRHVRVRRGIPQGGQGDDNIGGNPDHHIIVDHCSTSWGMDENLSLYRHMRPSLDGKTQIKDPVTNLTIQWCISSEALDARGHAFGGTWGGMPSTFHHNLFACNTARNPSIGMSGDFDYRNNVVFNWRHRTCDGGDETSQVNFINNYYKPGPATNDNMRSTIIRLEQRHMYSPGSAWMVAGERDRRGKTQMTDTWYDTAQVNPANRPGKWYVAGNIVDGNDEATLDNWKAVQGNKEWAKVNTPFVGWPVSPHQSARQAYESVLANAGATLPRRDVVDARVIESVRTGVTTTPTGIIKSIDEVGGYPEYGFKKSELPKDSDNDGMPDEWEKKFNLNPKDASDASIDSDGDGYTNIEEFINGTDPSEYKNYRNLGNNTDPLMKI